MNYWLVSLIKTKELIFKKKKSFLILVLLQFLALMVLLFVSMYHLALLYEDLQGVIDPLQQANLNQTSLEAGNPLVEDLVPLLNSYQNLTDHAEQWFTWMIGLFLILNGGVWVLIFNFVQKSNFKTLFKMWLKFLAAGSVFLSLLFLVLIFSFKDIFSVEDIAGSLTSSFQVFMTIIAFIGYLLLIVTANINSHSWKLFVRNSLRSLKKMYYYLPAVMLILVVIGAGLYLMFKAEQQPWLVLVLAVCIIVFLTMARIFWILLVNEELRKVV